MKFVRRSLKRVLCTHQFHTKPLIKHLFFGILSMVYAWIQTENSWLFLKAQSMLTTSVSFYSLTFVRRYQVQRWCLLLPHVKAHRFARPRPNPGAKVLRSRRVGALIHDSLRILEHHKAFPAADGRQFGQFVLVEASSSPLHQKYPRDEASL